LKTGGGPAARIRIDLEKKEKTKGRGLIKEKSGGRHYWAPGQIKMGKGGSPGKGSELGQAL